MTEEIGLFELTDFKSKNLKSGLFRGDQFNLTLLYSPYGNCIHSNKSDSKLIIEEYNVNTHKFMGCFDGKLNCEGKRIEVKASIHGTIP